MEVPEEDWFGSQSQTGLSLFRHLIRASEVRLGRGTVLAIELNFQWRLDHPPPCPHGWEGLLVGQGCLEHTFQRKLDGLMAVWMDG